MRRLPRSAVAVSATLVLAACSGGAADLPPTEPGTDPAPMTSIATLQDGVGSSGAAPSTDAAPASDPSRSAPDDVSATSTVAPGEATADTDGQAAADRTEEFLVAVLTADPGFCQLVVGFTGDAPLAESPDQLQLCEDELIPQLQADVEEQDAGSIETMQVGGASIDGDTARVSSDNFGGPVPEGFRGADIVLRRFNEQWYVDLGQSDLGG